MKYRTTDAEQRKNNAFVIGFDYCEIHAVEQYLTANAYTAGAMGWRADFYNINGGFTISSGYSPLNFVFNKNDKVIADYIRLEIKKLNKKLENHEYACQRGGDWTKAHKFVESRLYKIYQDAIKKHHTDK